MEEQLQKLWGHWFASDPASLVGAQWLSGNGQSLVLEDPHREVELTRFGDGDSSLVAQAVDCAAQAQPHWYCLGGAERGRRLWAVGQQLRQASAPLAALESLVAGKPIRDCRVEVQKVAEMFEYYAGWCDKLHGEVIPVPGSHFNYTRREPYGVVAQLTPWNAPLFTAGWQLAPALAAGNSVVLKPSELTPLSSLVLGHLMLEAGLPPGTVNILLGSGNAVGQALVGHPGVAKIVFVGSVPTGKAIARQAADQLTPCVLELGGKSANIVFADAELPRVLKGVQAAIFAACGQSCVAGSRLLVQRPVYAELLERLAQAAARIPVGDPGDERTHVGPLQNRRHHQRVLHRLQQGLADGAELCVGGERPEHLARGFYLAPTVLAGVDNAMPIAQEEIFGPILAVMPFDEEEQAIALANDNPFGLAGAVWTQNVARAHRVAAAVRAGTFWINSYKTIGVMSPFGGFGQSGYGRSSGVEGLHEYTQSKSVWVETAADPLMPFGYNPE